MQYLISSGSLDVPITEHACITACASHEEAQSIAQDEAERQRIRHMRLPGILDSQVSIEEEPADGVLFVCIAGSPCWRIAISLDLPLLSFNDLLDELQTDWKRP